MGRFAAFGKEHMAISDALDQLSCELLGEALDVVADGDALLAAASVLDDHGERLTCSFEQDSPEGCLEAARAWVKSSAVGPNAARCYAIVYEGAVSDPDDPDATAYRDAVLLEFGERGSDIAYSAYVLVERDQPSGAIHFTNPAPAGEVPCLL